MDGLFIVGKNDESLSVGKDDNLLKLILRQQGLEIMHQTMDEDCTIWFCPAEDPYTLECFYIIKGGVSLYADGVTRELSAGDSVYLYGLRKDIPATAHTYTEMLYITDVPMFDTLFSYNCNLEKQLDDIDRKDHTTRQHSRNVLWYVRLLFEEAGPAKVETVVFDELMTAAMFHDIGKCFTADEVLKKENTLTPQEYELIKKHPDDSRTMLQQRYSANAAGMAGDHHERLDGSGYPRGLSGDEISIGARMIAVAEAFDDMTAERAYKQRKTPEQAVEELAALSGQFDADIVAALGRLVSSGRITVR